MTDRSVLSGADWRPTLALKALVRGANHDDELSLSPARKAVELVRRYLENTRVR